MSNSKKHIAIIGAGLVGSLLSIYLIKRGYKVSVYERRADMRKQNLDAGRSINLALSNRGIRALESIGLAEQLKETAIPMHGRMMHSREGKLSFLPYGKEGQFINSISRAGLNKVLMSAAEQQGVEFHFEQRITKVDLENTSIEVHHSQTAADHRLPDVDRPKFDLVIGADGAFSVVRQAMQFTDRFDFSQDFIDHGYKELHIPPGSNSTFQLEKNALHIWPRESFMMIALPNPDGSFTCTLFFPFEGNPSFSALKTNEEISTFLQETFTDAVALMPDASNDYKTNPTSSLVTMKCFPWVKNKTLVIGDAAHAVVPFYGQGMNAGFEDCYKLNQLLDQYNDDWDHVLPEFQMLRKPDTDAIAQLALDNFIEMRDLVADPEFLLRKKIEAKINALYPDQWIPLYSMVTFNENIRYSTAYATGQKQKQIMDEVMKTPDIENKWEHLDFAGIVAKLG